MNQNSHHRVQVRRSYLNRVSESYNPDILKIEVYSDFKFDKQFARVEFLKKRLELNKEEIDKKSLSICSNLISHPLFLSSYNIAIYSAVNNEVDINEINKIAISLNKNVHYPRVSGEIIQFHKIDDLNQLVKGKFGILEPLENIKITPLDQIDLFVLPGICFDKSGNRIGYGYGYYDKSLENISHTKKIGLAYSFQVVEALKSDTRDKPVGYIATEKGILNTCSKGGY